MSALASILLDRGYVISGSDSTPNNLTEALQSRGATIYIGQSASNCHDADIAVFSSAIRSDNPERVAAVNLGIPLWHRSDLLSVICDTGASIGISGSHGKTTTSSMLAAILLKTGMDPTLILGGEMPLIGSNARNGTDYVLAEVDESDGSFTKLALNHIIVTNVDNDHLDHYQTSDKLLDAFSIFCRQTKDPGSIILGVDSPHSQELLSMLRLMGREVITCSLTGPGDMRAANITYNNGGSCFDLLWKDSNLGSVKLNVPGDYNIRNALCSAALALSLGIRFPEITAALNEFQGAARRFEHACTRCDVDVYNDYAHHPTEIQACLSAARQLHPCRLVVVFQPHLYSRTQILLNEFAQSFGEADLLILTDIYPAREDPIEGVDGLLLFSAVGEYLPTEKMHYVAQLDQLPDYILGQLEAGDLILLLGAGSINRVSAELCQKLQKESREVGS
ncbi:MAG: UDP-N-acetylmuramate--L-alanine ligase [Symbiobacteriaceae bacterium]|nr:UDP-N-acetylmuramate--L-alanine ligase [Symbiobacteriaceae bacterium]